MNALRYVLGALLALALLLLVWGLVEPKFYDLEEEVAPIQHLPRTWEGRRVAQISDFQLGLVFDNDGTVERIVDRILKERPTLVLVSGDFIYHAGGDPTPLVEEAAALIRPIPESGIPTYAVLGNHDYGMKKPDGRVDAEQAEALARGLVEAGVSVLQNESVVLPSPPGAGADSTPLHLVGLGPSWPARVDVEAAFSGVPAGAPTIVLMHNPNAFARLPAGSAPLAVAGHTHGGQIRIPLTPSWSWLTYTSRDLVHADGWIDGYGAPGNRLYVNRGIGMSTVPLRINCPPELTLFTLRRSDAADPAPPALHP